MAPEANRWRGTDAGQPTPVLLASETRRGGHCHAASKDGYPKGAVRRGGHGESSPHALLAGHRVVPAGLDDVCGKSCGESTPLHSEDLHSEDWSPGVASTDAPGFKEANVSSVNPVANEYSF